MSLEYSLGPKKEEVTRDPLQAIEKIRAELTKAGEGSRGKKKKLILSEFSQRKPVTQQKKGMVDYV